jgi:putative flavoprotein involved in K+ transport
VLGNGFARVVLAFAVLSLPGASPGRLSLVVACQAVPQLVFILATGVNADRMSRSPRGIRCGSPGSAPWAGNLYWWLARTGLDTLPIGRFLSAPPTQLVIDYGRYRAAVTSGRPDRRPVFIGASGTKVTWAEGTTEEVDTVLLATGYRPDLGYLAPLGTLDASGHPRLSEGISLAHPGAGPHMRPVSPSPA